MFPNVSDDIINYHNILRDNYGQERYKITHKYIVLEKTYSNCLEEYILRIEYTVKKCPKFYWKWWYIKFLVKNLISINKIK